MSLSKTTRNLALEIVRVTEAAALASGRWMGRGEKEKVDNTAVEAMRLILRSVSMDGVIVIGELLKGVKYFGDGARTDSLVVRGLIGAVRRIEAVHSMNKSLELSATKY